MSVAIHRSGHWGASSMSSGRSTFSSGSKVSRAPRAAIVTSEASSSVMENDSSRSGSSAASDGVLNGQVSARSLESLRRQNFGASSSDNASASGQVTVTDEQYSDTVGVLQVDGDVATVAPEQVAVRRVGCRPANGTGALDVRVTAVCDDTTLARIIHLVERAQATRAPSQAWVDRFAARYTPAVLVLAGLVAVVPPVAVA